MATRGKASRSDRQGQRMLLFLGLGIVAIAVLIGVLTASGSGGLSVDEVAGEVEITGTALPPHGGDPMADVAMGQLAPEVRGAGHDGTPAAIGGGAQVISFMAAWCPSCQAELPHLVDWYDEGLFDDGVELVVVSTFLDATRPNWPPQDWFEAEGYTGTVLVDDADSSVARAFGMSASPFWVVIDADGNVLYRTAGQLSRESMVDITSLLTQ
ncbi:MAG: TlpA disulfide reductase family protein [Nitriliruptoraceae bacterium]